MLSTSHAAKVGFASGLMVLVSLLIISKFSLETLHDTTNFHNWQQRQQRQ
jgi:hypothetical protein